jgi:hypothetical protein
MRVRATEWDIATVGVGDLLRKEINKGTPLGRRAEEVMKAGGELLVRTEGLRNANRCGTALLPDDIVLSLVEPELDALRHKASGVLGSGQSDNTI